MPSPSLALLLSVVLGSAAKIVSRETILVHFSRIASLQSLVRGSSVDSADVDIQWTQRDVQNDDKQWLVRLSEVFCGFSLTRAKKQPPI